MQINFIEILVGSVAVFALGALWYSPLLLGKQYMKIMGADKFSKEELQKMQKEMGPYYLLQFVLTFITAFTFLGATMTSPGVNNYVLAFWIWLGYIMPTQVACVIWGKTEKRFWKKQIAIMISLQFLSMMLLAFVFSLFR